MTEIYDKLYIFMYVYTHTYIHNNIFSYGTTARSGPGPPNRRDFTTALRHTTLRRTPPG